MNSAIATRELDCDGLTRRVQEASLVTAAKAGEEWAFVELYRRCLPMLSRAVYRVLKNSADVEDALQDCLFNAYNHLDNFDQRAAFSTWITRIGINSALMILRKRRKYREESFYVQSSEGDVSQLDVADPATGPEEFCIRTQLLVNLNEAIGRLPNSLRTVIELQQATGASVQEISNSLNISIPAVKSRLLRGRLELRKLMYVNGER